MKTTHLFAMHGHFGADRGVLALVIFAAAALLIAFWPDKSQTK
ncbi:MAG TPA: hypothetical protein VMR33_02620 [Candidatus Baltobacteraceae bacterium]|jgi:hypothetical protein|nr:hypothetical protein [Candidatus Baltobacteraceae bacterium]